jgi:hypothetical protein
MQRDPNPDPNPSRDPEEVRALAAAVERLMGHINDVARALATAHDITNADLAHADADDQDQDNDLSRPRARATAAQLVDDAAGLLAGLVPQVRLLAQRHVQHGRLLQRLFDVIDRASTSIGTTTSDRDTPAATAAPDPPSNAEMEVDAQRRNNTNANANDEA